MPEVELLDKTEVWIVGITLADVRLPDIAVAVASVLSLRPDRILVTDVRDDHVVLDVLQPRVALEAVAGKEFDALAAVAAVPGVTLAPDARIHSYGVLGVIGTPKEDVERLLATASELERGITAYVAQRTAVVSTGAEIGDHRVRDTNVEAAVEILGAAGFEVVPGGTVPDDEQAIAGRVARLVSEGFGLVITTGGVGAEDKDRTIEALQLLDPGTATAVLASYTVGHGRHVKESVRVGVATVGWSTVVALPGPTPEVRLALPVVVDGLARSLGPSDLAEAIAVVLRRPLRGRQH